VGRLDLAPLIPPGQSSLFYCDDCAVAFEYLVTVAHEWMMGDDHALRTTCASLISATLAPTSTSVTIPLAAIRGVDAACIHGPYHYRYADLRAFGASLEAEWYQHDMGRFAFPIAQGAIRPAAPLRVRAWDGTWFVSESGLAHRYAALARYDQTHQAGVQVIGSVCVYALDPQVVAALQPYHILLLAPTHPSFVLLRQLLCDATGTAAWASRVPQLPPPDEDGLPTDGLPTVAVFLPRASAAAQDVATALLARAPAVIDFSALLCKSLHQQPAHLEMLARTHGIPLHTLRTSHTSSGRGEA
jgi:hypothetical protein